MSKEVRCCDCANQRKLFGNNENIMCGVTNKIEPLYETLHCEDFEEIKKPHK